MNTPMRKTNPILKIMNSVLVDLPAPNNLSTLWNFGSLLGLCLMIQLLTGIFLAMHYTPHIDMAFMSCAHITRDVNYGWLMRNFHANGASWFFMCLYIHIGRGIYYASYRLTHVWSIGIIMFIATMAAAFLGYVLPWGQMSFWGATVITNLLSAIPYIGQPLVQWMWGGFAVDNATLNRFFALHFFVPFLIAAMSAMHIMFLHKTGSSNPLGLNSNSMKTQFHWAYTSKDMAGIMVMLTTLTTVVMFYPNMFGDAENWIPANPMLTPLHIKPEWYFLWAYAILRSIPNKLGGVVAMFSAMLVLFTLPVIFTHKKNSSAFYFPAQIMFWIFIAVCGLLTWIGGRPIEDPFDWLGQVLTVMYFTFFIMFPLTTMMWDKLIK